MNTILQTQRHFSSTHRAGGFYERLVLTALEGMPEGRLELILPDGSCRVFGGGARARWHDRTRAPAALAISESATIQVRRAAFFEKCALYGDIGFAEAYMDGDWETPDIGAVIAWVLLNLEHAPTLSGSRVQVAGLNLLRWANRFGHWLRPNSRTRAVQNVRAHYDLSNEFFSLWLDRSMMYSSGKWSRPGMSLEESQWAKNEALCRKLRLRPEDHVLEIGTGWGGWSLQAVRSHWCRVTTLTISQQQYELAQKRVHDAGLAERIEVRLQDYRDLGAEERFDKVVSIEMLEAVGHQYLPEWCRVVSRALKPEGLLGLQFIACPDSRYTQLRRGVDFIQKHVFPGSLLLSVNRMNGLLTEHGGFALRELEDLGQDYARTLAEWRENFLRRSDDVRRLGFDERFLRKWTYYLGYCEAAFAMRNISVMQTVHARPNNLSFA